MRIVISGTVGVGKSTTTEILIKELEKRKYIVDYVREETVNSPYLRNFYENPKEWAFIAQLDFLMERFKQWIISEEKRKRNINSKIITVYDRHFIDDYVFAELHSIKENISYLNSITYQVVYKELLEKIVKYDAKPDYFFLLKANLSTIVDRLNTRGRSSEKNTSKNYWKNLYDSYYLKPKFKYHFSNYNKKVIEINTENKTPEEVVKNIIDLIEK